MDLEIPSPMPDVLQEADWALMVKVVGLEEAVSVEFSSTHKDERWIDCWSGKPGMTQGWFASPKGIFIVERPYYTAINRRKLEALCKTQEVFNSVCPAVMYLMWRVTQNKARTPNPPS